MQRWSGSQFATGAVAGVVATAAHTAVMLSGHALAPRARDEPTPPRQITDATALRLVPDGALTERRKALGTAVLHIGYGALAGAPYPGIAGHERPVARGAAYGLGVWAASYLGWIPALGIPPPATRQPAQQNATMLLAHLAWGSALGATSAWAARRSAPA